MLEILDANRKDVVLTVKEKIQISQYRVNSYKRLKKME
jgi:hypothetical protein